MTRTQRLRLSGVVSGFVVAFVLATGLVSSARAASTVTVCGTPIQPVVDAASPGDTIQVCAGMYVGEVVIPAGKDNLTLASQTPQGATIKASSSLPATQQSAIVHVAGATGVTITGFTISGPGTAGCGSIGYGVLIDGGGSATVANNHITAIRDDPFSGCQNGKGIGAGSTTAGVTSPGSVTATRNTIDDYQKGAIDLRGDGSVNNISGNKITGAGSTPTIAQNGIQISRGASAKVTGNIVSDNQYQGGNVATGILVFGPVGDVTISGNKFLRNDVNIYAYNLHGNLAKIGGNTITDGHYGIIVDLSSGVEVDKNLVDSALTEGINAGPDAAGNTFHDNIAKGTKAPGHDCLDESTGSATASTANTWTKNIGDTRKPEGICSEAPVIVDVPPVIVLPPTPGTTPPTPAGPPGQKVGDKIIAKMRHKQLKSCVIELRALGPSRALVARGVAHAPKKGKGHLIVRIKVKPKGKKLLTKHFGGMTVNVRALCRSTSGRLHHKVKRIRAVLLIEHRLTPPGSWVPDQPILTGTGLDFMSFLRHRMFAVKLLRCDGYTATYPPSPAYPPTLSLHRAHRVCAGLKRLAHKARVRLVPHGLTNPIATNANEAGRRVNRRVFVTIVHVFVFRS